MGAEVRVCAVTDVADEHAKRIDVQGHRLCVIRIGDRFYAVDDECSHEDYSLSEGMVWAEECEIECPKHGSAFSLATGDPQSLPATRPVHVYEVRADGDDVLVTLP